MNARIDTIAIQMVRREEHEKLVKAVRDLQDYEKLAENVHTLNKKVSVLEEKVKV